jgi:hypothetical protein
VNTTYVVFPKSSGLYLVHVSLLFFAVFASHAPIIVYIATSPTLYELPAALPANARGYRTGAS